VTKQLFLLGLESLKFVGTVVAAAVLAAMAIGWLPNAKQK